MKQILAAALLLSILGGVGYGGFLIGQSLLAATLALNPVVASALGVLIGEALLFLLGWVILALVGGGER